MYSLADIGALMNNRNNDGMWGNGAWWIIILFFLLWGNNGWGNNRQTATTEDVLNSRIMGKLDNIQDGLYANNTNILTSSSAVQRDILTGFSNLGSEVANNRFASQQCCCETNRNIDAVRAENYKNTCEVVNAITSDGEKTRALITANQMQELRDRIAEKDQQLQTANFQLSQQAQSANIINTLQPVSKPAYITCSPYESAYVASRGYYGCGY